MRLGSLCFAAHLLWVSVSLGADGPVVVGSGSKRQAQWDLLFLYGFLAAADDVARAAAGLATWEVVGGVPWGGAALAAGVATRTGVGDSAGHAVRIATGSVVRAASKSAARVITQAISSSGSCMGPHTIGAEAATVAWLSVLKQRQSMLQAMAIHLRGQPFLKLKVVDWAHVMRGLQQAVDTPMFRRAFPEIHMFFRLAMLRLVYLTENDVEASDALRAKFIALLVRESRRVASHRAQLPGLLPPGAVDMVWLHEKKPTFEDLLDLLESQLFLRREVQKLPEQAPVELREHPGARPYPCVIL